MARPPAGVAPVKILVVGLGSIGQRHARNLRTLLGDKGELTAYRVKSVAPALAENMTADPTADPAERHGLQVFTSIDKAFDAGPRAVLVCNPSALHVPIAKRALEVGSDVFVEKPLSGGLEGVQELVELAESGKRVGMVGYQLRFHPCLLRMQELLASGAIGQVLSVRLQVGEYLPAWHAYEDYRQSYAARADLGGGAVLSQIHEIDLIYWLFGPPRKVFAVGGHLSSLEIDVEDVCSSLLECEYDGHRIPVHLLQDYVRRPPSRTIEVIGDAGLIYVDLQAPTLIRYAADGARSEVMAPAGFERNSLFIAEMRHFLACLGRTERPRVSLRDGAESLRIALAIKESAVTGRVLERTGDGIYR